MVVSNSSPLIYLAALGDFELLQALFGQLFIPQAVFEEVVINGGSYPVVRRVRDAYGVWILEALTKDTGLRDLLVSQWGIQAGEAEAIAVARELSPDALLMDDRQGIRCAHSLGLNVLRTTAIYRLAKQRGMIPAIAPKLDALRKAGFHLRDDHYALILKRAGEA